MDTPELDRLLQRKLDDLQDFRKNQKGLWRAVDGGYLVCDGFIRYTVQLPKLTNIETHRAMMWWTMLDYQMESFFLNINRQLDLALASLRMASELARDIARINNDEDKLHIWLNRENDIEIKKQYRKEFRFNDSDNLEKYAHYLYDLASSLGVHGHTLRSAKMRPLQSGVNKEYVILDIPDIDVFKSLEIWLAAFFRLMQFAYVAMLKTERLNLQNHTGIFRICGMSSNRFLPIIKIIFEKVKTTLSNYKEK